MKTKVYNQEAKEIGHFDLPEQLFGAKWNADLVHQVVTSANTSRRANTAQAKDRSAVRGGGKKPWRQKGTGRARHGSTRSPLWRGGGITHGPTTERNYDRKINKTMKNRALAAVLSRKLRDGEVVLLDGLAWPEVKTKQAMAMLNQFATKPEFKKINYRSGKRALLALPEINPELVKSFRNIASVQVAEARNLGPVEALAYRYILFVKPEVSLPILAKRF